MAVLTPRNEYLSDACGIAARLDRFLKDGMKGETPSRLGRRSLEDLLVLL
jgi:hypothetical protein